MSSTRLASDVPTARWQHGLRFLLGAAMVAAGIAHLTVHRAEFQAQVPDWVPMSKDLVVVWSGYVEIALGAAMIVVGRWKVWVGTALAVFFVLIFPGNVHQYVAGIDAFGPDTDRARLIRLFFQPVFVLWALVSTGALGEIRRAVGRR